LTIGFPGDGVLDITFIGDQYTDMAQWHADVQRISTHLLSAEPFQSRADQIHINEIDNTTPIAVSRDPGNRRLMYVDHSAIASLVEASGIKTDVIGVIVNDPEYGGSGGIDAASYNGSSAPDVFLHEFGHTFGGLYDEYSYGMSGPIDNQVHSMTYGEKLLGNVLAGTPPAPVWNDLVAPDEYFWGAAFDNWYRTSLSSIMRAVGGQGNHFNEVELHALTAKIDYWAGPSSDHVAPQVSIVGLHNGDTVSGVVHVPTNAVDDRAVVDTQLWVDGHLARNNWNAPFTLDWLTGHEALGTHTLQVKAFDATGNVGVSGPITVALAAGSDFQIVSPAAGSQATGATIPFTLSMWNDGADQFSAVIDGQSQIALRSWPSGELTVGLTSPLAPGPHTLTLIASASGPDIAHPIQRYQASITINGPNLPSVDFLAPAAGATVTGKITLAANVLPGTRSVQYLVDSKSIGTVKKAPFSMVWDSKKVKDGKHTLRLLAVNAAGQRTTVDRAITVRNIFDRKAPTVTLTAPKNNAKVKSGSLKITGRATDNVAVADVELLIDNQVVAKTSTAKYVFAIDAASLTKAKHKIRVRAHDTSGNIGWSPSVTIVRS
jgi:hypothetical protein